MAKIISIHSFRGGTGKSNTTANLSVLLASKGKRVGVVDTDIQSPGIHVIFGKSSGDFQHSLNDYLWAKCPVEQTAYDVTQSAIGTADPDDQQIKLFLIPSSLNTGEIARILREGYDVAKLNDGFQQLINKLNLDYLLIDTHPGVNEETLLSIAISDHFLLVLRPDKQDFQGTSVTIELARRLEVENISVMLNKVPESMDLELLKEQVESGYEAEVVGMLPLCSEMAELASSGLFVNRYPQHRLSQTLARIADRLV
ncbi:MAG: MinD/ParA family protein [Planctomicrobium sp.]|nr:MinD/ParA family protein [Planctomicrobium sp.]